MFSVAYVVPTFGSNYIFVAIKWFNQSWLSFIKINKTILNEYTTHKRKMEISDIDEK